MKTLRTPEDRFADLPGFDYPPRYADIPDDDGATVRIAWVEQACRRRPVLMLHGEPTWSYLYRRMIPILAAAGHRVICPDLIGFGRSDKPTRVEDHSYARHVGWIRALVVDVLGLRGATLVGQDWGGLIGLRVAAENPEVFTRLVVANTGLPTGDHPMPEVWWQFRRSVEADPQLRVSDYIRAGCVRPVDDAVRAAYDAPFPDPTYLAGPRAMPCWSPPPRRPGIGGQPCRVEGADRQVGAGVGGVQRRRPDHRRDGAHLLRCASRRGRCGASGDRRGRSLPPGGCRRGARRGDRRVPQQDTLIPKVPDVRKLGLSVAKPSAVPAIS